VIVRRALADADTQVREAALTAIEGLHFPHAFNPLARIYRESNDPRVRSTALCQAAYESLSHMDNATSCPSCASTTRSR
jgi:hypothetical protein